MVHKQRTIPLFRVYMSQSVDKPLLEAIHSEYIGQGEKVVEFETALSKRVKNPRCLTLSAGTHGLHLALKLAGIERKDEIITTPMTCFATTCSILMQGAEPIWADIKPDDLNIDSNSIKTKITKFTKAVMLVHWGGYPCDMEEIKQITNENDLFVIEDAAHAFGATYKDSIIGDCAYSDFVAFSFQAIKQVTTCDGGALFTKSNDDYIEGKLLRWYGIDREGPRRDMRCEEDILNWGYKYHMNNVCATIGLTNLQSVDVNLKIAKANVAYYRKELEDFPGITLLQNATDRESANWLFTILVEDRSGFSRMMGEKGIMVSRVHERNDKHSCVKEFKQKLPNLDYVIDKMICVPCGWWVSAEEKEYIIDSIKGGW